MNLYCEAPDDVPEQSTSIANLETLDENEWGSIKGFLIWAFDSQHICVTDEEYKHIDFLMTYDPQQGMDRLRRMAFVIQYSHISWNTQGAVSTVLVELHQSTLNCACINVVCSLNRILSFRNVFSVLSGQLSQHTS